MIASPTDNFLSEEDLDLPNLTEEELVAWWNLWLEQAQITNDLDRDEYAHGVFRHGPRDGEITGRAPEAKLNHLPPRHKAAKSNDIFPQIEG